MPPVDRPTLYDHTGRRVRAAALRRDLAPGGNADTRGQWQESLYRQINPTSLAWILYESRWGYTLDRFLSLAEDLEEVDTHYSGVLRARKRATTKLPLTVEPNGAQADIVTAVDRLIQEPLVRKALRGMLDALGKGFSCTEIMWQSAASGWEPRELKWRDPRFFSFAPEDLATVRLRTDLARPEPLPPFKFLYHQPELKSGLPVRNGLARLCAWVWLYKHFTLRDWVAFLEVYGSPVRVGKYNRGAMQEDVDTLKGEVKKLGREAAAVIPHDMTIEFLQVTNASGQGAVFEKAARYFDQALSKAVIGQTMTSESGGSLAQAKVHMEVAHDITEGDADDLAMTLSEQLVMPFVQLNWGPQLRYPLVRFEIPERPGENVEGDTPAAARSGKDAESAEDDDAGDRAEANRVLLPSLQALGADPTDDVDELAARSLRDWRGQMTPMVEDLEALLGESTSLEQARDRLPGLLRQWGERDHRFIDALGESGFLAGGLGNSE